MSHHAFGKPAYVDPRQQQRRATPKQRDDSTPREAAAPRLTLRDHLMWIVVLVVLALIWQSWNFLSDYNDSGERDCHYSAGSTIDCD